MMNRADREALIAKLQADSSDMLAEMAARRAQLGHDAFEPPPPTLQRKSPRQQLVFKTREPEQMPEHMIDLVRSYVTAALDQAVDVIGSECGTMERRIIERQDAELTALRGVVESLSLRLTDLADTVNDQEARINALENDIADVIDRSGIGRKVVAMFNNGDHRHAD